MKQEIADREKCGAGRGPSCCIFLLMGEGGWECGRSGPFREMILARRSTMNAQRCPTEEFPACQLSEDDR